MIASPRSSGPKLRVRTACESDAPALARLSRELAQHVHDPDPGDDAAEIVELGIGEAAWFECLVAELEGEVVGFASFCRRFELHTRARTLWLGDFAIAKAHRRKGIGQELMRALRRRAVDLGCETISLELWSGNASARAFYDQIGAQIETELEIRVIALARD